MPNNTIGSCLGIATLAALQTIPHFMLEIFHYHGNNSWIEITNDAREQFNNPSDDNVKTKKIASQFLGMEILKSWGFMLWNVDKLHYGNYLEYFTLLLDKNRVESTKRTFLGKTVGPEINYKKSYGVTYEKDLFFDMVTIFDILFPDIRKRLIYGELVGNIDLIKETPYTQQNSFMVRQNLKFLGISIRTNPDKKNENNYLTYEKVVEADNIMKYLYPTEIQLLDLSFNKFLPYWVVVSVQYGKYRENHDYVKIENQQVYVPYFKELLEKLDSKSPLWLIHWKIKRKPVPLSHVPLQLNNATKLEDIQLFEDLLSVGNQNSTYDVTAIVLSLIQISRTIDIKVYKQQLSDKYHNEIEECMKYQMFQLHKAYDIFEKLDNTRIRDNFMKSIDFFEDLFRKVCRYLLKAADIEHKESDLRAHAIALTRSLDGTHWNYVSNDVVYRLTDIRVILSALHIQHLLGIFYSKKSEHQQHVDEWREIVQRNKIILSTTKDKI
ncbi:hypothetical protein SNEBB_003256 [Seison nebaliae]|nr:hypothetical protein SNEBB_003256 [Seison nebaliae]